jgi:hypothetical protein
MPCKRGGGRVPFHLWITPDDDRAFFGIRRWNLDEDKLLRQFVEPYRAGDTIATEGEVIRMDQLKQMRIARSDGQLAPPPTVSYELDFFKQLEQVTSAAVVTLSARGRRLAVTAFRGERGVAMRSR